METKFVLSPDYDKPVFELDTASIPQCQINTLMDALLRGVREFYARPGVEEQFQEWLQNYKKNQLDGPEEKTTEA